MILALNYLIQEILQLLTSVRLASDLSHQMKEVTKDNRNHNFSGFPLHQLIC
jgi:hypothetical protein